MRPAASAHSTGCFWPGATPSSTQWARAANVMSGVVTGSCAAVLQLHWFVLIRGGRDGALKALRSGSAASSASWIARQPKSTIFSGWPTYMEAQLDRAGRPGPQVIRVHEIAIRAQEDFALDAKLKIGNDIWTPETAGARFYEQVLSKKPTTVQKPIDLASELKEQPFIAKQVMGHLKWLFATGELEVDGKSYTPKTKEPKAAKAPQAKPEAKAKKAEVKAAAVRKRSFVKTKKLAA